LYQLLQITHDRKQLGLQVLFWLFLVLVLITRFQLFFNLNARFIDADQPIGWLAAKHFSEGLFFEPRFYGQNYNTFMEAFIAVPLLWFKIPVYYALPIATHFIFLFPFVFTGSYLFIKNKKTQALLLLAMLLALPVAYDISTSISRGFLTGLFFTSFFVLSILSPTRLRFILLNTLMAILGYHINPNSMLVTAPFLLYVFSHNYKTKNYYLINLFCLVVFWVLNFLFNQFYLNHPDYVLLGLSFEFSRESFIDNFSHLDERLGHVSFFVENKCWTLLCVLLALPIILYQQNKKAALSFLLFIFTTLALFFVDRSLVGSIWPFYSYNRMYLGIPLAIALFLPLLNIKPNKIVLTLLLLSLVHSIYKFTCQEKIIAYETQEEQSRYLQILSLPSALEAIAFYKTTCEKNSAEHFLISTSFFLHDVVSYGIPALYDIPFDTQEANTDRRFWIREKNKNLVFKTFVFLSGNTNYHLSFKDDKRFTIKQLDAYGLYMISENTLDNHTFIELVKTFESEN
jgi:hypothetical protein